MMIATLLAVFVSWTIINSLILPIDASSPSPSPSPTCHLTTTKTMIPGRRQMMGCASVLVLRGGANGASEGKASSDNTPVKLYWPPPPSPFYLPLPRPFPFPSNSGQGGGVKCDPPLPLEFEAFDSTSSGTGSPPTSLLELNDKVDHLTKKLSEWTKAMNEWCKNTDEWRKNTDIKFDAQTKKLDSLSDRLQDHVTKVEVGKAGTETLIQMFAIMASSLGCAWIVVAVAIVSSLIKSNKII